MDMTYIKVWIYSSSESFVSGHITPKNIELSFIQPSGRINKVTKKASSIAVLLSSKLR